MKKIIITFILALFLLPCVQAQHLAVKTNAVEWAAAGTINAGVELGIAQKWSIDVDGLYNPWTFSDMRSAKMWGVQPELRYWFCRKFSGHFVGLHGQYANYDAGLWKYNYDGWLAGAGMSYGYSLPLHERWRLEFNLGLGWNYMDYDKNDRVHYADDVRMYAPETRNYIGITRAGISISFLIF